MDLSFSVDDGQKDLDLLSQSVSKHALDFLVSDESSRSLCGVAPSGEVARLHVPQESIAIFREGWRVICGRSASFLFDGRTERSGITHEKFVKVSVFSVYYLPSDPIDASFSSILG
jgi:hypothetical protein